MNKKHEKSRHESTGSSEQMKPTTNEDPGNNSDSGGSHTVSTEHLVVQVAVEDPPQKGKKALVTVVPDESESTEDMPGATEMSEKENIAMTSFKENYGTANPNFQTLDNQSDNQSIALVSRNVSILRPDQERRLENVDIVTVSVHQVAKDGDVEMMSLILSRMSHSQVIKRLRKKDKDRQTPLHYAARYNHFSMCQLLVENGADINARGEDDTTPLHLVAKYKSKTKSNEKIDSGSQSDTTDSDGNAEDRQQDKNNIGVLEYLINSGALINQKDFYGMSALHHASLRGNELVVEFLLKCSHIAIEGVDKQLMTPLHISAVYGHEKIAKMLVDKGASIRCKDDENSTPLHFAASEGNINIAELIIKRAQKLQTFTEILIDTDNDENTPLHLAVDSGHLNMTKLLLKYYKKLDLTSKLNMRRTHDETPLHLAASQGHLEIVKILVTGGARLNARDGDLSTPLIVACKFNHYQIVEYLLECGAKLEVQDSDGYTALLIAANYGHPETISLLVKYRTNLRAIDNNERSALHQCAMEDRVEALKELMKYKKSRHMLDIPDRYGNTPLHIAAQNGHMNILKVLIQNDCHIDLKNEDEQTPLHLAAANGRVKVLRELVNKDKTVINDDDEDANTALHLAALEGREQCVQKLIDLGANISARNAKQWTPLDCCAYAGHNKCAVVLLESDSPVDPKDKRKITPLHLACKQGHTELVKILLKWKADVSLRSSDGRNALDFAIDRGQEDCALAIIQGEQWREALRNRTKDEGTGNWTVTPMRKLIQKMPYVAEEVFNKCSLDNGKHPDRQEYNITFDYEFLDDEYSCKHWVEVSDTSSEVSLSLSGESTEVYDDVGRVNEGSVPYDTNTALLMKNHALFIMAESKRENLLRHPLAISLMNYKWKSYGRALYYTLLLIYTFFMAVLNSYMLVLPPPYALNGTASTAQCAVVVQEAVDTWGSGCVTAHSNWQTVATYILYVFGGFSLLKEIFQIVTHRHLYFLSLTNLIELAVFVLTFLLIIDFNDESRNTGIRQAWQWQCGAAAVFLSWIGLVLFIQNIPRFGIFVLMFTHILRTFISFFAVFLLFIFAFAFGFHALLQNRFAFEHWWNSLIKTTVMMIGEYEYDTLFDTEETSSDFTDQVYYDAITYVLFYIFVIVMSILLMNLMVGLAVDDIKEVQQRSELVRLGMQVNLSLDVEYTMPAFIRLKYMRKNIVLFPNQYRYISSITRWFLEDKNLSHEKVSEALKPEKSDIDEIYEKVEGMETNIQKLRFRLREVNNRSKTLENMMKAVVEHMNVPFDVNDEEDENS